MKMNLESIHIILNILINYNSKFIIINFQFKNVDITI